MAVLKRQDLGVETTLADTVAFSMLAPDAGVPAVPPVQAGAADVPGFVPETPGIPLTIDLAAFSALQLLPTKVTDSDPYFDRIADWARSQGQTFSVDHNNVTIFGSDRDDIINGDFGDDRLEGGDGGDEIFGQTGNDFIDGGSGQDRLSGGPGDDIIYGGDDYDLIRGGTGRDILYGEDGDDLIWGQDGDDVLVGGNGSDRLHGDLGNDMLFGCDGDDYLEGLFGNDRLDGGSGNNILSGGAGADTFVFTEASTNKVSDFSSGQDHVEISHTLAKSFADLVFTNLPTGGCTVTAGACTILFAEHKAADFHASDFTFV